jgi:replicative DNA helicase Mcm
LQLEEVSPAKVKDLLTEFLKTFKDERSELRYRTLISLIPSRNATSVVVDFQDLNRFHPGLAALVQQEPDLYLKVFDEASIEVLEIENPVYADKIRKEMHVRIKDLTDPISLREVAKLQLNTLIMVRGMVVRTSELRPMAVRAAFRCQNQHITYVEQSGLTLKRPVKCETEGCGENKNFELDDLKTEFIDFQVIRIQELPEELPPGQLPQTFDVNLVGDIVNSARPGDRITLTGIVKASEEFSAGAGKLRLFTYRIEGNFLEQLGKSPEETEITREEEEEIKALAAMPGAYDRLINSVAPMIYGHEIHKEAALLLMVGSKQKTLPDGSTLRGDVNILLVGDPGTAKSELLKYVARVAPRALYTSGRGTTAAGLTAAVVREKNGMLMLEAGATVLADLGVAVIDEFDKMRKEDRDALHEVMEQQSYHPSFEISLADGKRLQIGPYVDKLLSDNPAQISYGKYCEILPFSKGPEIQACELETGHIAKVRVDRVSRHKAPDSFVAINYSNGRQILVTPEHPVFVYREGSIRTVLASQVRNRDYAPVPKKVPNSSLPVSLMASTTIANQPRKKIIIPETLTPKLSRLLGFLVSEGHSYAGSSYEIGFSNTSQVLLTEVQGMFKDLFGIHPSIHQKDGVTIQRYISKPLYEWFHENFGELMHLAQEKRVPQKICGSSVLVIREFLASAFLGEGSVESASICYRTASPRLAEDYQDLLHKLGIMSRIVHDSYNDSFKVYIMGDSIPAFVEQVVEKYDPRFERLKEFQVRSSTLSRAHDTLPPEIGGDLAKLMKALSITYYNYFWEHSARSFGVNRFVVEKYLCRIEEKLDKFDEFARGKWLSLREARLRLGISQQKIAEISRIKRGAIAYLEQGGYAERQDQLIDTIRQSVVTYAEPLRAKTVRIRTLLEYRFLQISNVATVPNSGRLKTEWVYDVTVEPYHNFISKGLILHNTASVAKGGFIATLNARTSILAAANPVFGKYDPYKNILDNVSLPIPLLTRFDLVFIVKDEPDAAQDEILARHVLDMHAKLTFPRAPPIEFDMLKKCIIYAKKLDPELTEEARKRLSDYYIELRRLAQPGQIAVTPRWLEGLIRLSIARARILLHPRVTEDDALRAVRLMRRMLETVAVDQNTGGKQVDVGVLYGKPLSERNLLETALETFKRLEGSGPSKQPVEDKNFIDELVKSGKFNPDEADKMLKTLYRSGQIYETKPHFYRKI